MNPCPCGYATDPRHTCVCSPGLIRRYRARLSGPLLDRIDLHINVPAVPYEELQAGASPVTSARMRERVLAARAVQQARYAEVPYCRTNADLSGSLLEKHCRMGAPERAFLREAVQRLALSSAFPIWPRLSAAACWTGKRSSFSPSLEWWRWALPSSTFIQGACHVVQTDGQSQGRRLSGEDGSRVAGAGIGVPAGCAGPGGARVARF